MIKANKYVENCMACICSYCTRRNCPRGWTMFGKPGLDYCLVCQARERSAVYECDFFRSKRLRKYYRIKKRYKKKDRVVQRLEAMEYELVQLQKLIKRLEKNNMYLSKINTLLAEL